VYQTKGAYLFFIEAQMTTTVLLVRHGQTNTNISSFYTNWFAEDLNETGYAQSRRLASRLAKLPIASVYTSPLRRAYTTAAILAAPHKLELKVLDDLIEIRPGDWEGLHIDEIKRRWPELWQQSRIDPSDLTIPNGESFEQVTERGVRAFRTVVGANQGRQVLIVTHDIIVRVLVAHVLRVSNSIYRKLEVNNASLSVVRVVNGNPCLITLNDTSHLEE
jgi:broad specificity phosphatase PhoE